MGVMTSLNPWKALFYKARRQARHGPVDSQIMRKLDGALKAGKFSPSFANSVSTLIGMERLDHGDYWNDTSEEESGRVESATFRGPGARKKAEAWIEDFRARAAKGHQPPTSADLDKAERALDSLESAEPEGKFGSYRTVDSGVSTKKPYMGSPLKVGFLGLGKKERAHAEEKRKAERVELALTTEEKRREAELSKLRYEIEKAKLLKEAADAGVPVKPEASPVATPGTVPSEASTAGVGYSPVLPWTFAALARRRKGGYRGSL